MEEKLQQILWNYDQLRTIVKGDLDQTDAASHELSEIKEVIYQLVPDILKKSAPGNVYELLGDLQADYAALKDYVVYHALIKKNVVGLGGGFSSGKSSFINAMLGEGEILPENINPSTSVPTYIVYGNENVVRGINIFDSCMELDLWSINAISHGFGTVDLDSQITKPTELGHLLRNLILETNLQRYRNLAFLDTPGYSKPESENYSRKTDEVIARQQLNTVNYILWFLPVNEGGSLSESDIRFIQSLDQDIPVTIICSKANRRTEKQRNEIRQFIRGQIKENHLNVQEILFFDTETPQSLDGEVIFGLFDQWNRQPYMGNVFSKEFKRFFVNMDQFFDDELQEEGKRLNRLNQALVYMDCDHSIIDGIKVLIDETQKSIRSLQKSQEEMKQMEVRLFERLRKISDFYGFEFEIPTQKEMLEEMKAGVSDANKEKRNSFAMRKSKYASMLKEGR